MSSLSTWMGDSGSSVFCVLLLDLISRDLYTGCWLCVDAELAIGQCRLRVRARACGLNNPWHHQRKMVDLSLFDSLWISRMKCKSNTHTYWRVSTNAMDTWTFYGSRSTTIGWSFKGEMRAMTVRFICTAQTAKVKCLQKKCTETIMTETSFS